MDLTRLQRQVGERIAELDAKNEALARAEAKRVEASTRLQRETHALAKAKRKFEEQTRARSEGTAERSRRLEEREAWLDERERFLAAHRKGLSARKRAETESHRLSAEALWNIRYESVLARGLARRLHGLERRLEGERSELESRAKGLARAQAQVAAASAGIETRAVELERRNRRVARAEAVAAACAAEVERVRSELERSSDARHDVAAWLARELENLADRGEHTPSAKEIERIRHSAQELEQALRETAEACAELKSPTDAVRRILRGGRARTDGAPRPA